MSTYRVQIEASNLLVNMEGSPAKHGFITFRFVEADGQVAAEHAAVQMLRDDSELRGSILNDPADPPVMDVLEVVEWDSPEIPPQPGRVWYPMNPKRWWQFWR
jgi:hypothetical protein